MVNRLSCRLFRTVFKDNPRQPLETDMLLQDLEQSGYYTIVFFSFVNISIVNLTFKSTLGATFQWFRPEYFMINTL